METPTDADQDARQWAVGETRSHAERIAENAIRDLGYEPWLPLYRKGLKGVRIENGRRIRSRKDGIEERPLFPGYIFVMVPSGDDAAELDTADGMRRMLRNREIGQLKIIRARFLLHLREAVDAHVFDDLGAIPEGTTVRTPAGIIATVKALDDHGRADLLAEMLGQTTLIRRVPISTLEIVSA